MLGYLLASIWYAIPTYLRGWGRTPRARRATRITMAVMAFGALAVLLMPWVMGRLGYYY